MQDEWLLKLGFDGYSSTSLFKAIYGLDFTLNIHLKVSANIVYHAFSGMTLNYGWDFYL